MLELRPNCEHCGKALPPNARDARICSFECTFCEACVVAVLQNICPNCTGGFTHRPIRPNAKLLNNPAQLAPFVKPVDLSKQAELIAQYAQVPPENR